MQLLKYLFNNKSKNLFYPHILIYFIIRMQINKKAYHIQKEEEMKKNCIEKKNYL